MIEVLVGCLTLMLFVTVFAYAIRKRKLVHRQKENIMKDNAVEELQQECGYNEIDEQDMCDSSLDGDKDKQRHPLAESFNRTQKNATESINNDGYLLPCHSLMTMCSSDSQGKDSEKLSNSSTSEDDQGYEKVLSSKQTVNDCQEKPAVDYFEPLDIQNDAPYNPAIRKYNEKSVPAIGKNKEDRYVNDNDTDKEWSRHDSIQLYDNAITENEQNQTPDVFSFC